MSHDIIGIDVSKYQGTIDFKRVKAAGIEFIIVRAGYANYDGSITVDPYFAKNMTGAIAAGIPVGIYVYSYVETPAAAQRAAKTILDMAKPYKVSYPLCWDYEHATLYKNYSKSKNVEICRAALETWEAAGYYAMLYTYKSFANAYLSMPALSEYDFWLAHYTASTDYRGPHGMWQYSSSGSVSGISGRVDMNYAYKDYEGLIKNLGLNGYKAPSLVTYEIGPMSSGDAKQFADLAESLKVPYAEV